MTPVSYKHLCVETIPKRTGNSNPVMLGPVLIHFSKSKAVYRKFLDTLVQKRPALKSLKAFGTDGEVALFEALHESFPEALHLRCFRHFRKNLTEVIRHSGLQAHEDQFVEEVFGSNKTVGLLQAKSTVDFDEHLEDLTRIWAVRDPNDRITAFVERNVDMMKECMIEEVRVQAGLGSAPFYTNQSESLNFRLKSSVTSFKEMGLLAFVQAMENFSKAENQEVQLAYCCASKKMTVREGFKGFLECRNYFSLSSHCRSEFFRTVGEYTMEQLNSLVPGESALSSKALENFLPYFDIQPDQCNISVNVETLKSVFLKAYSYVSQPSEMMCEIPSLKPGVVKFSLVSHTTARNNEVTHVTSNNEVQCMCQSYSVHKICSHAVAVAQVQGVLPQYVRWHRQNKFGSNKTRRVLGEVNQRFIGRKPNKPRRSRKNKENHERATDVADNTTTVDVCSKAGLHDTDMYVRKLSGTRIVKCHGCHAKIREIPAVPPCTQ